MDPVKFPLQIFERLYSGITIRQPKSPDADSDLLNSDKLLLAPPALNLHSILQNLGHLPRYTTFLGVCPDGAPLFIDLANPALGSLLILGQAQCGKTHLVKTILNSASLLNSSDLVNYFVISNNAQELRHLSRYPHCQGIYSHYHRETMQIILGLSALAEQRRLGRERGPAIILAIDDLTALTGEYMDYELFIHFRWLLRFGPSAWIWPVVTLKKTDFIEINEELATGFSTRLDNSGSSDQYAIPAEVSNRKRQPYWQAYFARELIQFAVPAL